MIDGKLLLADLRKQVGRLEDDIRTVCDASSEVDAPLKKEYAAAREAKRTAATYAAWRDERITLAAVAWVLGCVFVRFLEDNGLVPEARLAGPGERLAEARDRETRYFREHPTDTGREYLLEVFRTVGRLPGAREVFDERHNPLWTLKPTGDAANALMETFRQIEPSTGALVHDFTDEKWDTRFLGDLYQDLSEAARKRYALLQTPEFVEEFILDRTLTPAIAEFGYREVRLIDPACGSGHFLLGAFRRLLTQRIENEPGQTNAGATVAAVLGQVFGVDVNPFAVAIARFRLLVEALRASGVRKLKDAPDFHINIYSGDSLLHGRRPKDVRGVQRQLGDADPLAHVYETEDAENLARVLEQQYHAVVGNPPYITPKDAALNLAYRGRFDSCHMKYALAVPFTERFFDLALSGDSGVGFVGMITSNSFMKREFGKKLIHEFIPRWDLTHVVDTSGAYIPGHGTPTVILFARNRKPIADTIRTVMGIRGEPTTPENPANGLVWKVIIDGLDHPGAVNEFVSVSESPRSNFHKHPWSIGGGGAAELKENLDAAATVRLDAVVESIGFMAITGEDDFFVGPPEALARYALPMRAFCTGDIVRDWECSAVEAAYFPYSKGQDGFAAISLNNPRAISFCWPFRSTLRARTMFGKSAEDYSGTWFAYMQFISSRVDAQLLIAFSEVASHNHFVLDRGERVFKQTAPVIKLQADATEDDHIGLLGLLNSSTSCYLMKQVAHQKQMMGGDGIRISDRSKVPYQFSGTQLGQLPIPAGFSDPEMYAQLLHLAREAEQTAVEITQSTPRHAIRRHFGTVNTSGGPGDLDSTLAKNLVVGKRLSARLLLLQEEIDFLVYAMFGLLGNDQLRRLNSIPDVDAAPGCRPYEILRKENSDGFPVLDEVPRDWPEELRTVWESRIRLLSMSADLSLIEDPHYKRRWIGRQGLFNHQKNRESAEIALGGWLCDRLEDPRYWSDVALTTTARLADLARQDADFMQVAESYRKRSDFDVAALVAELVADEAVPFLPVLRYKDTGLRKRADWEATWELQRAEDRIDARTALPEGHPDRLTEAAAKALKATEIGDIPVPPKYASADFRSSVFWRHRGKLDVPKERFVSYPHCSRDADPSPVIAWAGFDHLQQGRALATYHERTKNDDGWTGQRRVPLLAGILELVPWIRQWHNDPDPDTGERMGNYLAGYVDDETRAIGLTLDDLRRWQPPATTARRGRRAKG